MELGIFGLRVIINLPYRSLGLLLILIAATVIGYVLMIRLRRKRVTKFANYSTLKKIHGYKVWFPHPAILISKIIVITLLFLVATQSIELNLVKPVANTDFVIAIDSSQSMLIPDYEPSRISVAKQLAIEWINKLPATAKVGVITFSGKALPLVPLTTNTFRLENGIKEIGVNLNSSGTAIGDAIELAVSMLSTSKKQRFLILITDGKNNAGINLTKAVMDARKNSVIIYTIGIGETNETKKLYDELRSALRRAGGSNMNFAFPSLDRKELETISSETGGKFFLVSNREMFEEAFKNIIIRNERIPLNSDYYVLLFIIIMLIIEFLLYAKLGAL